MVSFLGQVFCVVVEQVVSEVGVGVFDQEVDGLVCVYCYVGFDDGFIEVEDVVVWVQVFDVYLVVIDDSEVVISVEFGCCICGEFDLVVYVLDCLQVGYYVVVRNWFQGQIVYCCEVCVVVECGCIDFDVVDQVYFYLWCWVVVVYCVVVIVGRVS